MSEPSASLPELRRRIDEIDDLANALLHRPIGRGGRDEELIHQRAQPSQIHLHEFGRRSARVVAANDSGQPIRARVSEHEAELAIVIGKAARLARSSLCFVDGLGC